MSNAALHMDRIYRWQRHIYDVTRKPYLLGRDRLIGSLGVPREGRVLEIGCGTGRNLIQAAQLFPHGSFYGFDISRAMLEKAEQSIQRAGLQDRIVTQYGDAVHFDAGSMFDHATFDRVFVSYSLSMIPEWKTTIDKAVSCLAPGGALLIADFHDCARLPAFVRSALYRWLDMFSVHPRLNLESVLRQAALQHGLKLDFQSLYGGYAAWAMLRKPVAPVLYKST